VGSAIVVNDEDGEILAPSHSATRPVSYGQGSGFAKRAWRPLRAPSTMRILPPGLRPTGPPMSRAAELYSRAVIIRQAALATPPNFVESDHLSERGFGNATRGFLPGCALAVQLWAENPVPAPETRAYTEIYPLGEVLRALSSTRIRRASHRVRLDKKPQRPKPRQ